MGLVVHLLVNVLALYLLTWIYSGVFFAPNTGFGGVLTAAFVLGVINIVVRPVLSLLSLPITILTLGLFRLVVNGVVIWLVAFFTVLEVKTFGAAIIGAFVFGMILAILEFVLDIFGLNGHKASNSSANPANTVVEVEEKNTRV